MDETITPEAAAPRGGLHCTEATAQPPVEVARGEGFCQEKVTYLQSTFTAVHLLTFKKEILNWRGDRRGAFDVAWQTDSQSGFAGGNGLEMHVLAPTHLLSGNLRGRVGTFALPALPQLRTLLPRNQALS